MIAEVAFAIIVGIIAGTIGGIISALLLSGMVVEVEDIVRDEP